MDTLQILQAISDRGMSASIFTGPMYVYAYKWKIALSTRNGETTIETTSMGNSFEETLQSAWETLNRKDAA